MEEIQANQVQVGDFIQVRTRATNTLRLEGIVQDVERGVPGQTGLVIVREGGMDFDIVAVVDENPNRPRIFRRAPPPNAAGQGETDVVLSQATRAVGSSRRRKQTRRRRVVRRLVRARSARLRR